MLKADEVQAQGTVNHTPVYPREVVRRALALGATSLILVHNHPSGDPAPSRDDIEMTKQVQQAAAVLQIGLRDHVIIGNGRCLSFREEGSADHQVVLEADAKAWAPLNFPPVSVWRYTLVPKQPRG